MQNGVAMKKLLLVSALISAGAFANAQSFQKGRFFIQISEGGTTTHIATDGDSRHHGDEGGDRDPLTIEYGLTDKVGVGLNIGTDLYKVDASKYFGFEPRSKYAQMFFSETTLDFNYHFYNTKKLDLSSFFSVGLAVTTLKGDDFGEGGYQYNAKGNIVRTGAKMKYYFSRRFGIMAMVSGYTAKCSPFAVSGNNVAKNVTTNLTGWAFEFGPCFKFR